MTTQEFVKKECEQYAEKVSFQVPYNGTNDFYNEERLKTSKLDFSDGLTKGLEIAVKALAFARQNAINGEDGCWDYNPHDQILHSLTDAELLTIFLTEKNEKK